MRRGIWRSGAKVAYGSCAALIAIAILGYSPTGRAVPTTLLPGQTLELDFPLIPALSSANALTFGWTSSYTGSSTTKLFDGPTLLGEFTGIGTAGFFRALDAPFIFGTPVDFTSILDHSLNAHIEFSIASGSVEFDPAAAIDAVDGPPVIATHTCIPFVACVLQTVTRPESITIDTNGVPEPSTIMLVLSALSLLVWRRRIGRHPSRGTSFLVQRYPRSASPSLA